MSSDITLDHPDWTLAPNKPNNCECAWVNREGLGVILQHFGPDKGLRDRLSDLQGVRGHYRSGFAKEGIGLIECDVFDVEGVPAVRAIGKIISQPAGAAYAGTIALPLPQESYVFNLAAEETGITGVREAAVMIRMMRELEGKGFTRIDPPQEQPGAATPAHKPIVWRNAATGEELPWAQDPYDAACEGPCLRNLADAPEHDVGFPQHPLSRVRAALQNLVECVRLSDGLKRRAKGKRRFGWW